MDVVVPLEVGHSPADLDDDVEHRADVGAERRFEPSQVVEQTSVLEGGESKSKISIFLHKGNFQQMSCFFSIETGKPILLKSTRIKKIS